MKNTAYTLYISGTTRAQEQWGSGRTYATLASANRRRRQIEAAFDFGVISITLIPNSLLPGEEVAFSASPPNSVSSFS